MPQGNLPPTSIASTTNLALLLGAMSSGYVRSFLRLAATRTTPSRSAAPRCGDPSPRRGDTIVVSHCQLSASEEGQAIGNNLKSAAVQGVRSSDVKVANEDVGGHSVPCFATDASSGAFQSKPAPPQHSSPCACCAVVAKGVKETATPAEATGERKGKTKATQQEHAKELGLQAGEWSARCCRDSHPSTRDLISARSPSDGPGINCNSLNCNSTREEASCCHPNLWAPGS